MLSVRPVVDLLSCRGLQVVDEAIKPFAVLDLVPLIKVAFDQSAVFECSGQSF